MTPELEALARRAVACPRFRWMPGMAGIDALGVPFRCALTHHSGGMMVVAGMAFIPTHPDALARMFPDLTDPATLGCILALVRETHGPATVVRLVGVNARGGQEWAVCDRAPAVNGWHLAAPALGYWASEVEALVAALENGGGGA